MPIAPLIPRCLAATAAISIGAAVTSQTGRPASRWFAASAWACGQIRSAIDSWKTCSASCASSATDRPLITDSTVSRASTMCPSCSAPVARNTASSHSARRMIPSLKYFRAYSPLPSWISEVPRIMVLSRSKNAAAVGPGTDWVMQTP